MRNLDVYSGQLRNKVLVRRRRAITSININGNTGLRRLLCRYSNFCQVINVRLLGNERVANNGMSTLRAIMTLRHWESDIDLLIQLRLRLTNQARRSGYWCSSVVGCSFRMVLGSSNCSYGGAGGCLGCRTGSRGGGGGRPVTDGVLALLLAVNCLYGVLSLVRRSED